MRKECLLPWLALNNQTLLWLDAFFTSVWMECPFWWGTARYAGPPTWTNCFLPVRTMTPRSLTGQRFAVSMLDFGSSGYSILFLSHFCCLHSLITRILTSFVPQDDPYWTAQYLSEKDRNRTANQTVCSLAELLRLAARTNRSVIFSLRRPPPQHPRHQLWVSDALKVIQRSSIQPEQVRAQHTCRHSAVLEVTE